VPNITLDGVERLFAAPRTRQHNELQTLHCYWSVECLLFTSRSVRRFRYSRPQDAPASSPGVVCRQRHGGQMVYFVSQLSIAVCLLSVNIITSKGRPVRCPAMVGRGTDPLPAVYSDLIGLFETHGLRLHLYADDSQIVDFCRPCDTAQLQRCVSACIDDVGLWMRFNRLQLNMTKTDVCGVCRLVGSIRSWMNH